MCSERTLESFGTVCVLPFTWLAENRQHHVYGLLKLRHPPVKQFFGLMSCALKHEKEVKAFVQRFFCYWLFIYCLCVCGFGGWLKFIKSRLPWIYPATLNPQPAFENVWSVHQFVRWLQHFSALFVCFLLRWRCLHQLVRGLWGG